MSEIEPDGEVLDVVKVVLELYDRISIVSPYL